MKEIITLFTGKYGLTRPEVMAEIETVFSVTLSRWYGLEVLVFFREDLQLEAVAYNNSGGVISQQRFNMAQIRGWNTLLRQLEENLARAVVLKQVIRYKSVSAN